MKDHQLADRDSPDQDARELRLVDTADPDLPELERVKLEMRPSGWCPCGHRRPRSLVCGVELVEKEGGTTFTEAAVARGLRWLAQQQQADGRWRLDSGVRSDSAATSLALLPFLGAGPNAPERPVQGRRRTRLAVAGHEPDGQRRSVRDSTGNTGMYAHGQGTIVLCEAYLMSGDESLRKPAQNAVDFVVQAHIPTAAGGISPTAKRRPASGQRHQRRGLAIDGAAKRRAQAERDRRRVRDVRPLPGYRPARQRHNTRIARSRRRKS